jgi:hypothetical protein
MPPRAMGTTGKEVWRIPAPPFGTGSADDRNAKAFAALMMSDFGGGGGEPSAFGVRY